MQFYIPEISDEIRLLADWQFGLYDEERNASLGRFLNVGFPSRIGQTRSDPPVPVIIPAGTILIIDRVYIRKGHRDFSSITFRWKDASNPAYYEDCVDYGHIMIDGVSTRYDYRIHGKISPLVHPSYKARYPKEPIRFWAKLKDVNKIEYEKV